MNEPTEPRTAPQNIHSDREPFSMVPHWLIDEVSPRALQAYAILATTADYADGRNARMPNAKLAKRMRCSVSTVEHALTELRRAEAIETVPEVDDDGRVWKIHHLARSRSRHLQAVPDVPTDPQDAGTDPQHTPTDPQHIAGPSIATESFPEKEPRGSGSAAEVDPSTRALADQLGAELAEIEITSEQLLDDDKIRDKLTAMAKAGATPSAVASRVLANPPDGGVHSPLPFVRHRLGGLPDAPKPAGNAPARRQTVSDFSNYEYDERFHSGFGNDYSLEPGDRVIDNVLHRAADGRTYTEAAPPQVPA